MRHIPDVQQHFRLFAFRVSNFVDAAAHDLELLGEIVLDIVEELVLLNDPVLLLSDVRAQTTD